MEVRNRQSKGYGDNVNGRSSFIHDHRRRSPYLYSCALSIIVVLIFYFKPYVLFTQKFEQVNYGVIFDAGSTGSRVHVYKIANQYDLTQDVFREIKPGLSAFAGNPTKGAESLIPLLEIAKNSIPEELWSVTPIVLKATAGLRLLPQKDADDLLNAVLALFRRYPFRVDDDAVHIISGIEEGLYSWITLNYYLGAFADESKLLGVIDLGGGSVQITFQPSKKETIAQAPADFLTSTNLFGKHYTIYTKSYLGLGLKSAMLSILKGQPENPGNELKSPCISPKISEKWHHANKDYIVRGVNDSIMTTSRFVHCHNEAIRVITALQPHKPEEITKTKFCDISYFFDAGIDASLISENGGELLVSSYRDAAIKECAKEQPTTPFLCLELTYISALLQHGFGFHENTPLLLAKKINGYEVCWALGAMFDVMSRS